MSGTRFGVVGMDGPDLGQWDTMHGTKNPWLTRTRHGGGAPCGWDGLWEAAWSQDC